MEGALGFSDGKDKQDLPTPILTLRHKPGDYEKVTSIASGTNHLIICTTHGNLYTFGAGEQGQLGRKILERRKIHGTHPEKISLGTRSRKAVSVGAGSYHSFAIDDRGDVWAWGLNTMGQTGTGWSSRDDDIVLLPKKVESLSRETLGQDRVVQICGGEHHTLFLTQTGKVYACGRMDGGQLGLDEKNSAITEWKSEYAENFEGETPQFLPVPTLVTFPGADDPVSQISCGLHNNAAVTRNGALYSWGQGIQGELGCGDEETVQTPRVVVRREGGLWFATSVSCGGQHTLALLRKRT
jgi:regulator of chromosome condensation